MLRLASVTSKSAFSVAGRARSSNADAAWIISRRSLFSSSTAIRQKNTNNDGADTCDLRVVGSPYPSITPPPYPPLPEFVSADWAKDTPSNGWLLDKTAIVDGTTDERRTFRDYRTSMRSIAGYLKNELGVDEYSTVAIHAPNRVDYTPIMLGVATTGAKLTPVNPVYLGEDLERQLVQSRSDVLIADASTVDEVLKVARRCKRLRHVVTIPEPGGGGVAEGTIGLDELRSYGEPLESTVHAVHRDSATHTFVLPYSSGTTGLPKGVCLSHANVVVNLLQLDEVEGIGFPTDHKLISPLPFFHIYGLTCSAVYCAWRGQTLITTSGKFDFERFCSLVEQHQPQRAHLVPPIMLGLAKHPLVDKFDMKSLKVVISAAAPLGTSMERNVEERLVGCKVKQGWGMSEISPLGTLNSDFNAKSGSIGPCVPDTFAKIVDIDTGKALGPNESGEFVIKGPQVMMGYLDAPDATAECLSDDGWLRTGDIAHYDEDGYFYITDRLKELIKVKGFQVAPAELEELLLTHESIQDACVVPVSDEKSGEVPRAYVVRKKGDAADEVVTEEDIVEWVKERVAHFKRLAGGVVFVDEIPKSASGKLLRRILKDKAKDETR